MPRKTLAPRSLSIATLLAICLTLTSGLSAEASSAPIRPGCWNRSYAEKHDRCGYLFGQKLTESEVNCLQGKVFGVSATTAAALRGGGIAAAAVFGAAAAVAWYECVVKPE